MGAELFDVKITISDYEDQNYELGYATKISIKRNRDTKTTNTFSGDITTISGHQNGGTISTENISWAKNTYEINLLENMLKKGMVKSIVCTGKSYTFAGEIYERVVTGTNCIVTTDEDEWSTDEGVTTKLEFSCNDIVKEFY